MSEGSGKPWGGRFSTAMADAMTAYTSSLAIDETMVAEDIWGSLAHCLMLESVGLLGADEATAILRGLSTALDDHRAGRFVLRPELEDVHMNVEAYLSQGGGAPAGAAQRLHTARSRNDQVLCDCRQFVRARLLEVEQALYDLAGTMLGLAAEHSETVMPGYTHSQHAQPITVGFWASAHVTAWLRDARRLRAAWATVNQNPLGACALAGTDLPIDRELTTRLLGFDSVLEHALDATSARDFLQEAASALAICMLGLSRLAEELVWWSSHEFRLITLDDAYSSGSSIMPQKKNPDTAELTRGKAARVLGDLTAIMALTKSVSLGYSRDLQEDKPPVWDALAQVHGALVVLSGTVGTMRLNTGRMRELVDGNFAVATQLANALVADQGLAFRAAHHLVGAVVGDLTASGATMADVPATQRALAAHGCQVEAGWLAATLDPLAGVARQSSQGAAAPQQVQAMVARLRVELAEAAADRQARENRVAAALEALRAQVAARLG